MIIIAMILAAFLTVWLVLWADKSGLSLEALLQSGEQITVFLVVIVFIAPLVFKLLMSKKRR